MRVRIEPDDPIHLPYEVDIEDTFFYTVSEFDPNPDFHSDSPNGKLLCEPAGYLTIDRVFATLKKKEEELAKQIQECNQIAEKDQLARSEFFEILLRLKGRGESILRDALRADKLDEWEDRLANYGDNKPHRFWKTEIRNLTDEEKIEKEIVQLEIKWLTTQLESTEKITAIADQLIQRLTGGKFDLKLLYIINNKLYFRAKETIAVNWSNDNKWAYKQSISRIWQGLHGHYIGEETTLEMLYALFPINVPTDLYANPPQKIRWLGSADSLKLFFQKLKGVLTADQRRPSFNDIVFFHFVDASGLPFPVEEQRRLDKRDVDAKDKKNVDKLLNDIQSYFPTTQNNSKKNRKIF